MVSRGRSRNRGSLRNRDTTSRPRRHQADQTFPYRTPDRFQIRRRSTRIAQHQEELLHEHENENISGVTTNMTDIARRTYPRNDAGPRVVDPNTSRRAPDSPQRRRRESASASFVLETQGSRLPSKIQTDSRINLRLIVTTHNPCHMRNVNHQTLMAVATLVDDRTGAALPAGYLTPGSDSSRSRLMQPIGPAYDVSFEDLVVKQSGTYKLKVTLMRMPEASAAGGQAPHVAEWESDGIRVQALPNGA